MKATAFWQLEGLFIKVFNLQSFSMLAEESGNMLMYSYHAIPCSLSHCILVQKQEETTKLVTFDSFKEFQRKNSHRLYIIYHVLLLLLLFENWGKEAKLYLEMQEEFSVEGLLLHTQAYDKLTLKLQGPYSFYTFSY